MMVDELFKSDKEFGAFEENVNRYKGMSNQYKAQLNFKRKQGVNANLSGQSK